MNTSDPALIRKADEFAAFMGAATPIALASLNVERPTEPDSVGNTGGARPMPRIARAPVQDEHEQGVTRECEDCAGGESCVGCGGTLSPAFAAAQTLAWANTATESIPDTFWRVAATRQILQDAPCRDGTPEWATVTQLVDAAQSELGAVTTPCFSKFPLTGLDFQGITLVHRPLPTGQPECGATLVYPSWIAGPFMKRISSNVYYIYYKFYAYAIYESEPARDNGPYKHCPCCVFRQYVDMQIFLNGALIREGHGLDKGLTSPAFGDKGLKSGRTSSLPEALIKEKDLGKVGSSAPIPEAGETSAAGSPCSYKLLDIPGIRISRDQDKLGLWCFTAVVKDACKTLCPQVTPVYTFELMIGASWRGGVEPVITRTTPPGGIPRPRAVMPIPQRPCQTQPTSGDDCVRTAEQKTLVGL